VKPEEMDDRELREAIQSNRSVRGWVRDADDEVSLAYLLEECFRRMAAGREAQEPKCPKCGSGNVSIKFGDLNYAECHDCIRYWSAKGGTDILAQFFTGAAPTPKAQEAGELAKAANIFGARVREKWPGLFAEQGTDFAEARDKLAQILVQHGFSWPTPPETGEDK